MPKLQAAVPPGAPPNALLRVRLPDGNEVNVRVPNGLKPGDSFIFEVTTSGGVLGSGNPSTTAAEGFPKVSGGGGGGVGSSGKKGDKTHNTTNANKQASKNPKKKAKGGGVQADNSGAAPSLLGGRGGAGVAGGDHSSTNANNNKYRRGGVPSFVTAFFNMYNQVYDILSEVNHSSASSSSSSSTMLQRKSSNGSHNTSSGINPPSSTFQPSSSSISPSQIDSGNDHNATEAPLNIGDDNDDASLASKPRRLLDKEITSYEGLMIAMAASTFIGLSLLVGFVGGVLYATPEDSQWQL